MNTTQSLRSYEVEDNASAREIFLDTCPEEIMFYVLEFVGNPNCPTILPEECNNGYTNASVDSLIALNDIRLSSLEIDDLNLLAFERTLEDYYVLLRSMTSQFFCYDINVYNAEFEEPLDNDFSEDYRRNVINVERERDFTRNMNMDWSFQSDHLYGNFSEESTSTIGMDASSEDYDAEYGQFDDDDMPSLADSISDTDDDMPSLADSISDTSDEDSLYFEYDEESLEDKISDLPNSLISNILSYVSENDMNYIIHSDICYLQSGKDFQKYDYTRKEYICRDEYYENIFGDKVIVTKKKLQLQSGNKFFTRDYLQNMFLAKFNNTYDEKYVAKLADDVITFITMSMEDVKHLNRIDTIIRAAHIFIKCRFNESTYHTYRDRIIPYIKKIFGDFFLQSNYINECRNFLNSYKNICESEIAQKLHKCCMFLMCTSVFEKFGISFDVMGYTKLEQAAIKKKFHKRENIFYVIADTLLFIFERGYQVFITGDINTIFHSGGAYKDIYDKCRELHRQVKLLSNPEAHGFTESLFRANLDNVIEKLTNIKKHSFRLNKMEIVSISSTLNDMLMMRDDLNTKAAARKQRKAPFAIEIFGDSGIGKTTITHIIATYFAKHENLPFGSEFIYTRNPAAKYWDGYTSSCHTIILDDVANEAPSLQDSKSLTDVIQLINNAAFCPDQASLENKGTTPMRARLVIGTTNVKDLNAYHYFSCPSAVQRRFPFIITPTVKREYMDERGMLNSANVPDLGPYPDLWDFKIERVKPVKVGGARKLAELDLIMENANMFEFLSWFDNAINIFNEDQIRVKKCLENTSQVDLCQGCRMPDTLCKCELQSGVIQLSIWTLLITFLMSNYYFGYAIIWFSFYTKYKRNMRRWNIARNEFLHRFHDGEYWYQMGCNMSNVLKQPKAFLSLATVVTGIYLLYKSYNRLQPQSGISDEVGTRPVSEVEKSENVWYNNDIDLSPANFSRESSSSKNMEFSQFCAKIAPNVIHIGIVQNGEQITGKAICLGGHIYMTNNHGVPDIESTDIIVVQTHGKGVNTNMRFNLSKADIHRVPEKDLAFLTLRTLPPKKSIIDYFQLGESNGIFNGKYIIRNDDGSIDYRDVAKIKLNKDRHFNFPERGVKVYNKCWYGKVNQSTVEGDCGSPLIINSAFGYSIVGIHFLGTPDSTTIIANNVDGNFIREIYTRLTPFNVQAGSLKMISSKQSKRKITDLHKKSVFRYLPTGNAEIYGSFTDFRGKMKSRVEKTPMNEILSQKGYETKYTAPVMKSWVPWHIAAKDLVQPIGKLDTSILNKCVESYINDVLSTINIEDIGEQLMVLDNFTAINGAQVTYIDKINRNTSAGNPWKKSKKYFLTSTEAQHGMMDPVEVDDEIMDRVDSQIETYLTGTRVNPNFCAHLKDEPVSFKKAKVGKTRVFTGAPFDWTIVVRKYLLSFTRLLQNNRLAFESGPGTIAQSLEWQELYDYIVKHGEDRIAAGDYKAFDKRMSPKEILAAFDIIIYFCEISGNYTEDDIRVIRGIAEDTAFALVDYNGDLVALFGSNPSGNPLTVILNGLVNSIRMRYCYYILNPEKETNSFGKRVSLMTYGDDNIMSISREIDWFNHTSISETFAKLDIVYTMADKEAESIPFIHIKDASFLKRTWRFDENLKCMMAPLDHDSIEKSLMVWTRSKTITEEAQGIAIISTAMREYFFYGEQVFNEKRKLLQKLVSELSWDIWVEESTFPTYASLCQDFINSSRRSSLYQQYFGDH